MIQRKRGKESNWRI